MRWSLGVCFLPGLGCGPVHMEDQMGVVGHDRSGTEVDGKSASQLGQALFDPPAVVLTTLAGVITSPSQQGAAHKEGNAAMVRCGLSVAPDVELRPNFAWPRLPGKPRMGVRVLAPDIVRVGWVLARNDSMP